MSKVILKVLLAPVILPLMLIMKLMDPYERDPAEIIDDLRKDVM